MSIIARCAEGESRLYFASKILAVTTPLPLGISYGLPRGGNGFFLELHIISNYLSLASFSTKLSYCEK